MNGLTERFSGDANRLILVDALRRQILLKGDSYFAQAFAGRGELVELSAGQRLVEQGGWDSDLYFILAGAIDVVVSDRKLATHHAGVHVGELSGLDAARPRTATLIAATQSLVLRVSQATVEEVAGDNADFWRVAANVVAERLDQLNRIVAAAPDRPARANP